MSERRELSDRDRIEEAHGHWEFCIVRVNTLVEALNFPVTEAQFENLMRANQKERQAYNLWQSINDEVTR